MAYTAGGARKERLTGPHGIGHNMNSKLAQTENTALAAVDHSEPSGLQAAIIEALKTVYDPEIPVNIYELGLIYGIEIDENNSVRINMTLTAPGCPVAGSLVAEVRARALAVEGVSEAEVDLVWDPPWSPSLMSEAARLSINF